MVATNFPRSLSFVWRPAFDSPLDGYHTTAGDPGRGTKGGVTQATWIACVEKRLVSGTLEDAPDSHLSLVLHDEFWGRVCDNLPDGLDLLMFNGRIMTGWFPRIFQRAIGFIGKDVDGIIGPDTMGVTHERDVPTLIHAITGAHDGYLHGLGTWAEFGGGWEPRLAAARMAALELYDQGPHPGDPVS